MLRPRRIRYGYGIFFFQGAHRSSEMVCAGGTAIRCSPQCVFTGRGGVWLKLVIGSWHKANTEDAKHHPRKSTTQDTTHFTICLTLNNYHFQSILANLKMAGKFEPKEPVQLNPPKSDPISLDELSKATGKFKHTLTSGPCHTVMFIRCKLDTQEFR